MAATIELLKSFLIASVAVNSKSSGQHVTVRSLMDAHARLFGCAMPLQKLGYPSLDRLIEDALSDTFQVYRHAADLCVRCLVRPAGQNIVEMMRREKPKKKRNRGSKCRPRFRGGGGGGGGGSKKPPQLVGAASAPLAASKRLSAPPSVLSRFEARCQPAPPPTNQPPIGLFNLRPPPRQSCPVPDDIRRCAAELAAEQPGLSVASFDEKFFNKFGIRMPYKRLGFASLLGMLQELEAASDVKLFNLGKYTVVLSPSSMRRSCRVSLPPHHSNSLLGPARVSQDKENSRSCLMPQSDGFARVSNLLAEHKYRYNSLVAKDSDALLGQTVSESFASSTSSKRSDVPDDCVSPRHRLRLALRQLADSDGLVQVGVISADSADNLLLSISDCPGLAEQLKRLPGEMSREWPADGWRRLVARHVTPGALCVVRLGGRLNRARIVRLSAASQQPLVRLIDSDGLVVPAPPADLFYLPKRFAQAAPAVILSAAVAHVRVKNTAAAVGCMRQLLDKAGGRVLVRLPPDLVMEPMHECRVPVDFVSPPLANHLIKEGFGQRIKDAAFRNLKEDLIGQLPKY